MTWLPSLELIASLFSGVEPPELQEEMEREIIKENKVSFLIIILFISYEITKQL
tara:strand:+ start:1534 stop:1695 length:162 start_codon:yes stop_codon:yes gene_type:complete